MVQMAQPLSQRNNLDYLDRVLIERTWLVNKKLTLADIHVFCALLNKRFPEECGTDYTNITRWYKHMLSLDVVKKALSAIEKNKVPLRKNVQEGTTVERTKSTRKQEGKFIDLPGAEMGKVKPYK